jgi:hypothetical protein
LCWASGKPMLCTSPPPSLLNPDKPLLEGKHNTNLVQKQW